MHLILFKNRRLNKAESAFSQGNHKKALKLGRPLTKLKNSEMVYQANRVCGLALYKLKRYNDSLSFLEKACELGNYRHNWYNLTMAMAYAGKLEQAEEAFQNIYRTNVQPGYMYAVPVPGLLFQYMRALIQKQFTSAAIARANELKQMYVGVGSDITKQVARGLPSLPMFFKEVQSLFEAEEFKVWKETFKA